MKSFPRDVLLRRIDLLERQYEEQFGGVSDRRPLRERFLAAAARIRARAAADDAEFFDHHLRRVMGIVGLFSDVTLPRPAAPRTRCRAHPPREPAAEGLKPTAL